MRFMLIIGGKKLKQLQPEYQRTFGVTRSQVTRFMPLSGAYDQVCIPVAFAVAFTLASSINARRPVYLQQRRLLDHCAIRLSTWLVA